MKEISKTEERFGISALVILLGIMCFIDTCIALVILTAVIILVIGIILYIRPIIFVSKINSDIWRNGYLILISLSAILFALMGMAVCRAVSHWGYDLNFLDDADTPFRYVFFICFTMAIIANIVVFFVQDFKKIKCLLQKQR